MDDAFRELEYDFEIDPTLDDVPKDCAGDEELVPEPFGLKDARIRFPHVRNKYHALDWYMNIGDEELQAKRRKVEFDHSVGFTMNRIVEARNQQKLLSELGGVPNVDILSGEHILPTDADDNSSKPSGIYRFPPMNGLLWYGINSADGSCRRYVSVRTSKVVSLNDHSHPSTSSTLTDDEFFRILEQVRRSRLYKSTARQESQQYIDEISEIGDSQSNGLLWANKFSPSNVLDLITDYGSNRLVLLWLRLWDEWIFKKKLIYDSLNDRDKNIIEVEYNKGVLIPKLKSIILHGLSGVGKSVLAGIAAKHTGYQCLVINLSEITRVEELKAKLENSFNMASIDLHFKSSSTQIKSKTTIRPNCIIIEDIESASSELLNSLVSFISKPNKRIRRGPVILTCCNLYAQNLKQIRSCSLPIKVSPARRETLLRHFRSICNEQRIKIDDSLLLGLYDMCNSNVRLLLNTLQFYGKGFHGFNSFGREEGFSTVSIFDALDSILTINKHTAIKSSSCQSTSKRCRAVLNSINQIDDTYRFVSILFFNTPSHLSTHQQRKLARLFTDFDRNHSFIARSQNFLLSGYQLFILLAIHLLCAINVSRRLAYTLASLDRNDKHKESVNILNSLSKHSNCSKSYSLGRFNVLFLIPYLYVILQPPLQAAKAFLQNSSDMIHIRRIATIMIYFGISFAESGQTGTGWDDTSSLYFQPPIQLICCYHLGGKCGTNLTHSTKSIIFRQIQYLHRKMIENSNSNETSSSIRADIAMESEQQPVAESYSTRTENRVYPIFESIIFNFKHNHGSSQAIRRNIKIDFFFKK